MTARVMVTALGCYTAVVDAGAVVCLRCGAAQVSSNEDPEDRPLLDRLENQLNEYFLGKRRSFDLPLRMVGTGFQTAVWEALRSIPYGETRTYGEVAEAIGRPGAGRAVGAACGRNQLLLLIPCHRVVGKNGSLTGFSAEGGLRTKRALLELERRVSEKGTER